MQNVCPTLNKTAIPRLVRSKTHFRSGWEICLRELKIYLLT